MSGWRFSRATSEDVEAVTRFQHAAYARNRALLGVEPLPLMVDYADILRDYDVWLAHDDALAGVLILKSEADHLLIWSVATAGAPGRGLGNRLLAFAEDQARALGLDEIRLYTGEKLTGNIAWYERKGYVIVGRVAMTDRVRVDMAKRLV